MKLCLPVNIGSPLSFRASLRPLEIFLELRVQDLHEILRSWGIQGLKLPSWDAAY